jgi:hypothetical protein
MVDVLTVVSVNDKRTIGKPDVEWWLALADDGNWPSKEFALAAVIRHANDRPGVWLEPGHITAYATELWAEANKTFAPPGPTRENIDDERAQAIARTGAFVEHYESLVEGFISPQRKRAAAMVRQIERARDEHK